MDQLFDDRRNQNLARASRVADEAVPEQGVFSDSRAALSPRQMLTVEEMIRAQETEVGPAAALVLPAGAAVQRFGPLVLPYIERGAAYLTAFAAGALAGLGIMKATNSSGQDSAGTNTERPQTQPHAETGNKTLTPEQEAWTKEKVPDKIWEKLTPEEKYREYQEWQQIRDALMELRKTYPDPSPDLFERLMKRIKEEENQRGAGNPAE